MSEIMKGAMKVAYRNEMEYCRRVVDTVNSVAKTENCLLEKECEIVTLMCKICIDGGDYMKSKPVIELMKEKVCQGTMRNYRSKIRKKGWLEGKGFNMVMRRAIKEGGIGLGIFLSTGR